MKTMLTFKSCIIFQIPNMTYEHFVKLLFRKFAPIYIPTKMFMSITTPSHICPSLPKLAIIDVFLPIW